MAEGNAGTFRAGTVAAMSRECFEIGHLSDTHLGFKQYPSTSGSGRNQREVDFSRSFRDCVDSIVDYDPPLVIHSGDEFDNARPAFRHVMLAVHGMNKLASNGRVVVIAGGNHDMPADANEASPVDLHSQFDNVYVSSRKYKVIDCSELVAAGKARPELDGVAIHLLPHDALKDTSWDEVVPWEGYTNILVSHCVVGGSELYKRSIGREFSLPIDVVTRGWHYVALGHYHKQGPVAVGGFSETTTPAWYAGSTENNGFSDVRDAKTSGSRGWLSVKVDPHNKVPSVTPVDLPIRSMFRLPNIDAEGLTHAEVTEQMIAALKKADVAGAVVRQVVVNLHPDTWGLVDVAAVRAAATDALWYEPKPEFATLEVPAGADVDGGGDPNPLGDLSRILDHTLESLFGNDPHGGRVGSLARNLLGDALGMPEEESCCHGTGSHAEHTHATPAPDATGTGAVPAGV